MEIDCDQSKQFEFVDQTRGGIFYIEHGSPSDLIRWHSHEPYELHLMVSTKGKVFVGDYIGRYEPGQLILTGPNVPHNWVNDQDTYGSVPLRDMAVLFSHESIESILKGFPEAQEVMSLLEFSRSGVEFIDFDQDLATDYFTKIRDKQGIARLIIFLEFMDKLNRWPNKRMLSTAKISSSLSSAVESKINQAVQYITSHYQEELSLKQAADLVNMSESSFSRNFQKATCNKFVEFVNRVRVGRACIMLSETDKRISSICFEVGFNNITHFNRQFHRLKGQTPGEYRKIIQDNLSKDHSTVKPNIGFP